MQTVNTQKQEVKSVELTKAIIMALENHDQKIFYPEFFRRYKCGIFQGNLPVYTIEQMLELVAEIDEVQAFKIEQRLTLVARCPHGYHTRSRWIMWKHLPACFKEAGLAKIDASGTIECWAYRPPRSDKAVSMKNHQGFDASLRASTKDIPKEEMRLYNWMQFNIAKDGTLESWSESVNPTLVQQRMANREWQIYGSKEFNPFICVGKDYERGDQKG